MQSPESALPTPSLTRRGFLQCVSLAGGALLLSGCRGSRLPTEEQGPSPILDEISSQEAPSLPTDTPTATLTPSATWTPTQTLEPSPLLLPYVTESPAVFPLPQPEFASFMPLQQALQERRSSREFQDRELPVPIISSLLWAGFGVNRPDGKRTAPSAFNVQDIDIYLVTAKGVFRYRAGDRSLLPLLPVDLRTVTGTQSFVAVAPLELVYVSDHRKMSAAPEEIVQWSFAHTGCILQNVYLACAALGLATVVRSTLDRDGLAARLGLEESQHITLVQTVGFLSE